MAPASVVLQVVPVDVELAVERVVAADLLQLVERRRHDGRVEQADRVQGSGAVGEHLLRRRRDGARVVGHLGVGDVVGRARGVDVALEERLLAYELAGTHLELLDDQRVERADDDAGEDEQACADHRDHPVATEDVDEEERGHQHRDGGEDVQRRQDRVDVGVLQAGEARDQLLALGRQREAVEPVRHRLQQDEQADEQAQLGLRGSRRAVALGLQAQAAVEVLHRDDGQDAQEEDAEAEADEEAVERQLERVERQVHVELRIRDAERRRVAPQQVGAPLGGGRQARDEAEADRDQQGEAAAVRLERDPVALQARLLGRHPAEGRARAPGDPHRQADRQPHERAEDQEHDGPGDDGGGEHLGLVDRHEPQPVGVVPGEDHEGAHEQGQDDDRGQQHASAAGRLVDGCAARSAGAAHSGHLEGHLANLRQGTLRRPTGIGCRPSGSRRVSAGQEGTVVAGGVRADGVDAVRQRLHRA